MALTEGSAFFSDADAAGWSFRLNALRSGEMREIHLIAPTGVNGGHYVLVVLRYAGSSFTAELFDGMNMQITTFTWIRNMLVRLLELDLNALPSAYGPRQPSSVTAVGTAAPTLRPVSNTSLLRYGPPAPEPDMIPGPVLASQTRVIPQRHVIPVLDIDEMPALEELLRQNYGGIDDAMDLTHQPSSSEEENYPPYDLEESFFRELPDLSQSDLSSPPSSPSLTPRSDSLLIVEPPMIEAPSRILIEQQNREYEECLAVDRARDIQREQARQQQEEESLRHRNQARIQREREALEAQEYHRDIELEEAIRSSGRV